MEIRRLLGQTAIILSEYEATDDSKRNIQFTVLDGSSERCNSMAIDVLRLFEGAAAHAGFKTSGDPEDGLPNDQDPPDSAPARDQEGERDAK